MTCAAISHRHGLWAHDHHSHGPHRHARLPFRSDEPGHHHDIERDHGDGHSHGLVGQSIRRSRAGVDAIATGLGVLAATAALQAIVFVASGSVALLADLIHNAGDALTAIPLGIAFVVRSRRAERWAGHAVVAAIFVSACIAGLESLSRLAHPRDLGYLAAVAVAGVFGSLEMNSLPEYDSAPESASAVPHLSRTVTTPARTDTSRSVSSHRRQSSRSVIRERTL